MTYGMNYIHEGLTIQAPVEPRYEVALYNVHGFALGPNSEIMSEGGLSSWIRNDLFIECISESVYGDITITHSAGLVHITRI